MPLAATVGSRESSAQPTLVMFGNVFADVAAGQQSPPHRVGCRGSAPVERRATRRRYLAAGPARAHDRPSARQSACRQTFVAPEVGINVAR
jgi:hypothetical protein